DSHISSLRVRDIMASSVVTTTPDAPVEQVARLLREHKIGALPVVRGQELVGIITESDIFRAFISLLGSDQPGLRISFDATEGEDPITLVSSLARRHQLQIASIMSMLYQERRLLVVRTVGRTSEQFVEDLWNSGHKVLNVLKMES
ncbi:MAG: CBS domain-containing protein, partial [Candidatus Tectimicrobiota bacterium]